MTDSYIDADETQIYGPHASRAIRSRVSGLVPELSEAMGYLADQIDGATVVVKNAVDASREAKQSVREGVKVKSPIKRQAKKLLGRFSNHLAGHKEGVVDRKTYFVRDGTALGVGGSADRLLQAVVHIATELSKETCPVLAREEWLAEFREMEEAFAEAVEHSDNAKTDRRVATPEVRAAREAWLQTYTASKCGVECALRLAGKLHMMKLIFHDLAVPSSTKVTEPPPDLPDEPEPEETETGEGNA